MLGRGIVQCNTIAAISSDRKHQPELVGADLRVQRLDRDSRLVLGSVRAAGRQCADRQLYQGTEHRWRPCRTGADR